MEYLVIYEQSQTGWGAYVPDLPGLGVVGDTFEEVERLIADGIVFHLEALRDHGYPIPKPSARSAYVPVSEDIA
jgi:predicted RNase H-like HicB family nuclease